MYPATRFEIQPQVPSSISAQNTSGSARTTPLTFTLHDLAHAMFFTGEWNDPWSRRARRQGHLPRAKLSRQNALSVSLRLIRSLITLRLNMRVAPKGASDLNEIFMRPTTFKGELSERRRVVEDLGKAMTGIYCYKHFRIVQLLHESQASIHFDIRYRWTGTSHDGQRPDLIGINREGYGVIAEAKGRSGIPPSKISSTVTKAVSQLCAVTGVRLKSPLNVCDNHQSLVHRRTGCGNCKALSTAYSPHERIGCVVLFEDEKTPMQLYVIRTDCSSSGQWIDVDDPSDDRLNELVAAQHLLSAYQLLYSAVQCGLTPVTSNVDDWSGPELRVISIPNLGISFGMLAEIHSLTEEFLSRDATNLQTLTQYAEGLRAVLPANTLDDPSTDSRLFLDGSFFQADWMHEADAEGD